MNLPKIFVQIASYRDDELVRTIRSCLKNARHPERLTFGICLQYDDHTKHSIDEYRKDDRFRIQDMPWQEARGAGYARYICNNLWREESFTLQVDAHTRFAQSWDESLIDQWQACGDDKAVLSVYPLGYTYDDDGNEQVPAMRRSRGELVLQFFVNGDIPKLFSQIEHAATNKNGPSLAYFVCGGMLFCRGKVCREVLYDRDVAFIGEEVIHSLRLFTAGYTIYRPHTAEVYHLYRTTRSHYWQDQTEAKRLADNYRALTKRSYDTVRAILNGKMSHYLGTVRTLEEFEMYVGIDFKRRLVHPDHTKSASLPLVTDMSWQEALYPLREHTVRVPVDGVLPVGDVCRRMQIKIYDGYRSEIAKIMVEVSDFTSGGDFFEYQLIARTVPRTCSVWSITQTGRWLDEVKVDLQ